MNDSIIFKMSIILINNTQFTFYKLEKWKLKLMYLKKRRLAALRFGERNFTKSDLKLIKKNLN